MNEKDAPTTEAGTSRPLLLPTSSYRPAIFVAFFACFLWLPLVVSGWFDELRLPTGLLVLLGLFIPVLVAAAILYRSPIFRGRQPAFRMAMLVGFGFVLLVVAFALWTAFSFVLFGLGIIGPD